MKKILAILLAAVSLVSLASCGASKKGSKPTKTTEASSVALLTLPDGSDSKLFNNVPKPNAVQSYFTQGKDDKGYRYTFEYEDMGYENFKSYVDKLKKAGFTYFSTSANAIAAKEPGFKKNAEECGYRASWLGVRSGLYVYAEWYGDEFHEKNKITGPNCRLTFWTYNPFAAAETTQKTKK